MFAGPFPDPNAPVRPAIKNQGNIIKAIWNNEKVATFGIERLFRLALACATYLFPGIYIREISGRHGRLARKLSLDAYVVCKLAFPALALVWDWQCAKLTMFIVAYLGVETLHYVASILFLSDVYKPPISHKRSYLMFLMNYTEITLDFAVLYAGMNLASNLIEPIDSIYFSFVTAFTIGYGDKVPDSSWGKFLVILQSVCSLFFITVAFAKAVAGFEINRAKAQTSDIEGD